MYIKQTHTAQILYIMDIHNESKNGPTHHLDIKHCVIQQENTFNTACTIGTVKTYPIQNYICKMLKKPTPTPRILQS